MCTASVYDVSSKAKIGVLIRNVDLGEPLFKQTPFAGWRGMQLEANTESLLRAHFVLLRGPVYLFAWELSLPDDKIGESTWKKEVIWTSGLPTD